MKTPESFIYSVDLNLRSAAPSLLMRDNSLSDNQRAHALKSLLEIRLMLNSVGKVFREEMRQLRAREWYAPAGQETVPSGCHERNRQRAMHPLERRLRWPRQR